jgi:hypothetical protein
MESGDPPRPPSNPAGPQRLGSLPAPSVPPPARGPRPTEAVARDRDPPVALLASSPPPAVVSADKAIAEQIAGLELWASSNRRDAMQTAVRFWVLKAIAGGGAIATAVAASFGSMHGVVLLSGLVVLAIAVDSASSAPSNLGHQRAFADIRHLQNGVKLTWDKVRITCPDPHDPVRQSAAIAILDDIQSKREHIRRYVGSPQGPIGVRHPS